MILVQIGRTPWIIFRIIHGWAEITGLRVGVLLGAGLGCLVFGGRLGRLCSKFLNGRQYWFCGEAGELGLR